ncbi:unnamed protein product [Cyprideis torosa]|uniref:Uncharacterized protein n=1 Tax=Cyprideis torosa TaxID=163714 RepID=A0A7R8WAZ6_9CRUS|nr:unnamed protein product [Cyprideis torosa]CAG0891660.1 unnamed protein product [Cyprideis torosa]
MSTNLSEAEAPILPSPSRCAKHSILSPDTSIFTVSLSFSGHDGAITIGTVVRLAASISQTNTTSPREGSGADDAPRKGERRSAAVDHRYSRETGGVDLTDEHYKSERRKRRRRRPAGSETAEEREPDAGQIMWEDVDSGDPFGNDMSCSQQRDQSKSASHCFVTFSTSNAFGRSSFDASIRSRKDVISVGCSLRNSLFRGVLDGTSGSSGGLVCPPYRFHPDECTGNFSPVAALVLSVASPKSVIFATVRAPPENFTVGSASDFGYVFEVGLKTIHPRGHLHLLKSTKHFRPQQFLNFLLKIRATFLYPVMHRVQSVNIHDVPPHALRMDELNCVERSDVACPVEGGAPITVSVMN